MRRLFASLALAIACIAQPIAAQDDPDQPLYEADELADELIHSDLPLYNFDWEEFWPRSISKPGIVTGCASRVAFGDWEFRPSSKDWTNPYWLRVENYGAFHCFANFYSADERDELADGDFSRGFFVKIGELNESGQVTELWAIQEGTRPGSDYVLLSREPMDVLVDRFTVLQRRCPKEKMRGLDGQVDIASISYCSINSRGELLAFAKEMTQLAPQGELLLSSKEKGPDTQAPDPS